MPLVPRSARPDRLTTPGPAVSLARPQTAARNTRPGIDAGHARCNHDYMSTRRVDSGPADQVAGTARAAGTDETGTGAAGTAGDTGTGDARTDDTAAGAAGPGDTAAGAATGGNAGDRVRGWFSGRLPADWFTAAPDIQVDREEITIIGALAAPAPPATRTPSGPRRLRAGSAGSARTPGTRASRWRARPSTGSGARSPGVPPAGT